MHILRICYVNFFIDYNHTRHTGTNAVAIESQEWQDVYIFVAHVVWENVTIVIGTIAVITIGIGITAILPTSSRVQSRLEYGKRPRAWKQVAPRKKKGDILFPTSPTSQGCMLACIL